MANASLAKDQSAGKTEARVKAGPAGETGGYDVLYQVHVPTFADFAVKKLNEFVKKELAKRKPEENDESFAVRKQFSEGLVDCLSKTLKELDQVSLGWRLRP